MSESHVAALFEHDIEVEGGGEVLVELHRPVVEPGSLGRQVVGANDGRISTGTAATDVTLLEHGDVGDSVIACQVIGRGQAMDPTADDDHVVRRLQVVVVPDLGPGLASQAAGEQPIGGILCLRLHALTLTDWATLDRVSLRDEVATFILRDICLRTHAMTPSSSGPG